MARGLAELDIGQTVVVKKKAVVAAEAMEGTDRPSGGPGMSLSRPSSS